MDTLAGLGERADGAASPRTLLRLLSVARGKRALCDLSAWMTGQYVALALTQPACFPQKPCFFPLPAEEMTDEQIKACLRAVRKGTDS